MELLKRKHNKDTSKSVSSYQQQQNLVTFTRTLTTKQLQKQKSLVHKVQQMLQQNVRNYHNLKPQHLADHLAQHKVH